MILAAKKKPKEQKKMEEKKKGTAVSVSPEVSRKHPDSEYTMPAIYLYTF